MEMKLRNQIRMEFNRAVNAELADDSEVNAFRRVSMNGSIPSIILQFPVQRALDGVVNTFKSKDGLSAECSNCGLDYFRIIEVEYENARRFYLNE